MSHWTDIKTQIKDITALEAACKELALPLLPNAVARGYGNQTKAADFVVRCPGPYDIAVQRQPDGTYSLTTDWWGGHVVKVVGKEFGTLIQLYGIHKATQAAKAKGYTVQRQAAKNGAVKLVIGVN